MYSFEDTLGLNPDPIYSTDDDVINFYNSALSCTKTYDRASAYFSSGFYSYIEKGLQKMIEAGGRMRLILSTEIPEDELEKIKIGYENKNDPDFVEKYIKNSAFDFSKVQDMNIVSYLIAIDKLDIHFAFKEIGLYHDKYAILEDYNENKLLISGSNNETEASIAKNHESFEITPSWGNTCEFNIKKIKTRQIQFEKTWNNEIASLIVLPCTEALKAELIERGIKTIRSQINSTKLIRLSIDTRNIIRIQTNLKTSDILNDWLFRYIKDLQPQISSATTITLPLNEIKDILEVKDIVKQIANKYQAKFILTKDFEDYLEKNYIDFTSLSKIGLKIKNLKSLQNDADYKKFRTDVQNLLKRALKEAQLQAAYHITQVKRTMNFSVPGSGKTASIIGAYEYLHSLKSTDSNYISRILVLGPLNCFKAWKEEFATVSKQYERYNVDQIIDIKNMGDYQTRIAVLSNGFLLAKLILINFEAVNELADTLEGIVDNKTMVVFDEIHRIKNYNSEKVKSCKRIIQNTKFRVALTGTPLPNGYNDLLCMFELLYGEYAQSYFEMDKITLKKADKTFNKTGIEAAQINEKIFPFYIRTSKDELQIPPAEPDILISITATKNENKLYNSILNQNINSLDKTIKLTELACIPERLNNNVVDSKEFMGDDYESNHEYEDASCTNEKTTKINYVIEELKKIEGKVVIWCIYTDTIRKLHSVLSELNFNSEIIYGETSQEERNQIIDRFNNSNSTRILITNPHTLAESVSLHKACHIAFYVELNFNLAQYLQSRDRIHRLGLLPEQQTKYYLFLNTYNNSKKTSIDWIIYERLKKKEDKMREAIEGGALLYRYNYSDEELEDIINKMRQEMQLN